MKTSKEIKVLAAVIALCLLVGIGCGAAAMGSTSASGAGIYVTETIEAVEFSGAVATNTVLVKNIAPVTHPGMDLIGVSTTVIRAGETNDGPSPVQRQGLFE